MKKYLQLPSQQCVLCCCCTHCVGDLSEQSRNNKSPPKFLNWVGLFGDLFSEEKFLFGLFRINFNFSLYFYYKAAWLQLFFHHLQKHFRIPVSLWEVGSFQLFKIKNAAGRIPLITLLSSALPLKGCRCWAHRPNYTSRWT